MDDEARLQTDWLERARMEKELAEKMQGERSGAPAGATSRRLQSAPMQGSAGEKI